VIKSFWLAAALLLAAAVPAQAQQQDTAEQMVAACHAVPSPQDSVGGVKLMPDFSTGYCWGAFTSLQSAATALDERGHSGLAACVPADTTRVQLIDAFVRYAGGHPELAQKDYFAVALAALREAYPCKEAHGLFK
jgi:dienelactone hydrolase